MSVSEKERKIPSYQSLNLIHIKFVDNALRIRLTFVQLHLSNPADSVGKFLYFERLWRIDLKNRKMEPEISSSN